jgi:hypothetical protein
MNGFDCSSLRVDVESSGGEEDLYPDDFESNRDLLTVGVLGWILASDRWVRFRMGLDLLSS